MIIGIIGLGLIGGSIAKNIKKNKFASLIIGYNRRKLSSENALKLNLIDRIVSLNELCNKSHLIILAIPVDSIIKILPTILSIINNNTVVIDVGSTKELIINSIKNHLNRKRFVPSHPMSGMEETGAKFAQENLFLNKIAIICDHNQSDNDAVLLTIKLYKNLGSKIVFMNSEIHDLYIGYISHLPHVISYALAINLLEKEKKMPDLFKLAAGGLKSTLRLAKSSDKIWVPIFKQNTNNIISIIDDYINSINKFKNYIKNNNNNEDTLKKSIIIANKIKKILK